MLQNATLCCIFATTISHIDMTTAVRVSNELVTEAKRYSKIEKRSVTAQIEYWAKIGKYAEENSGLTYSLIKELIVGLAELDSGETSEYTFG